MITTEKNKSTHAHGIKIANPIYDTVFKYLMENKRIARFFIETLINEKVTEIAVIPQEYVYKRVMQKAQAKENQTDGSAYEFFSIIRYDFVATICTETGEYKKVVIEIQKSRKFTELERFRKYIGEQYHRVDVVNTKTGEVEKSLPIICIYLLTSKDQFVEALTHDGYFIQIPRIQGKPRNLLEKMLSIFEQQYFIDDNEIVKTYEHQVDNDIIKEMLDILCNVAADPEEIKAMEAERLAIKDEEGYEQALKTIAEQGNTITTLQNEKAEHGKIIAEQSNTIAAQAKELADLKRRFGIDKI